MRTAVGLSPSSLDFFALIIAAKEFNETGLTGVSSPVANQKSTPAIAQRYTEALSTLCRAH